MMLHRHGVEEIPLYHWEHIIPQLFVALPFVILLLFYILAAIEINKKWKISRLYYFCFGVLCSLAAVIGPLAMRTHADFVAHMTSHLLLGMLGPLLMTVAAPMTLLLRTIEVRQARRLTRFLKSKFVRILMDPIVATLLNVGGLWLLYTTNLYMTMQHHMMLHIFIHIHVFLAGYLFTATIITIDPTPHRSSFLYRAIVLILALAAHGILSKYIYAHPPTGVPVQQAKQGGMLMFYGGDLIDAVLIIIFCSQWYHSTRPNKTVSTVSQS